MLGSKIINAALAALFLQACMADQHDVRVSGLSANQNLVRILIAESKVRRAEECRDSFAARKTMIDTGRGRGISKRHSVTSHPTLVLGIGLEPLIGWVKPQSAC